MDYLSIVGIVTLVFLATHAILPFVFAVYAHFLRPAKNLRKYGQYAVITGATDGIGRAYAFELAKKGLDIVLISRSADKLEKVKSEIESKFGEKRSVKTLAIDYGNFDSAAQASVSSLLSTLDVGILINNVGQSYDHPEYFHSLSLPTILSLLQLNISSTTLMTQIVLPSMVEKKRGAIVNVSSFSSLISCPLLSEYSAAKAYVDRLSVSLHDEYASKGVHIQVQNPVFVTTKLAKLRHASLLVPTPETYAKAAVKRIGYEAQCSPYWPHALQTSFTLHFPKWIVRKVVTGMHLDLRKRALKKKASEKKE